MAAHPAKLQSMLDQRWALMADRIADVQRIAIYGLDGSERDSHLAATGFHLIVAEVYFRRSQSDQPEAKS